MENYDSFVKLSDAAKEFGLSTWTLLRWAREGRLGAVKLPTGGWRFSRSALEEFKRGLEAKGRQAGPS